MSFLYSLVCWTLVDRVIIASWNGLVPEHKLDYAELLLAVTFWTNVGGILNEKWITVIRENTFETPFTKRHVFVRVQCIKINCKPFT